MATIKNIQVMINRNTTDLVILYFDIVEAVWPFKDNMAASYEAAKGEGIAHVKLHFPGITTEVIDCKRGA